LWRLTPIIRRHWLDTLIALAALAAFWLKVNYLLVFLAAGGLRLALGLRLAPEKGQTKTATPSALNPGPIIIQAAGAVTAIALGIWMLWHWDQALGLMSWIFLKISVVAFGGGYVMIPILQWDMVDHLRWLNQQLFLDGILLSFITPGPIIILATFVGFWIRGFIGALVGTVAIFLPPILIVIFLAPFYQRIKEGQWMRPIIQGILSALIGMLVLVTVQMGRASLTDWQSWVIMVGAVVALIVLRVNLLWVVLPAAVVSLVLF
jgi:chromate transporter